MNAHVTQRNTRIAGALPCALLLGLLLIQAG